MDTCIDIYSIEPEIYLLYVKYYYYYYFSSNFYFYNDTSKDYRR